MDIAYLPDCISYLSSRRASSTWENAWVDINPTTNKLATGNRRDSFDDVKVDQRSCQLCKEKKRKSLSIFIRERLRRDSEASTSIREEDEEVETKGFKYWKQERSNSE